jgi:putative addiction module CopG family antidote
MTVEIPSDLQDFVQAAITSGNFKDEGEVVGEALRLLRQREQLRADVNVGLAQLDAGQYAEYDEHGLRARFVAIKLAGRQEFNRRSSNT